MALRITGLGMLNSLGIGKAAFWDRLLDGASGIAPIEGFDTARHRCKLGAQIRGFDPKAFMPPLFYRRLSRLSRLAVAASIEAFRDSAFSISDDNRSRVGAIFGTAFGSVEQTDLFYMSVLNDGPNGAEPILFPDTVPNAPASHVAMHHRMQGPNSTFCQNHLSGECALAFAASLLELGQADALVVGGVDELSPILLHSLDAIRALKPCTPHDPASRFQMPSGRGFIPGEGATCMVIERDDGFGAEERQNRAYGTLAALAQANYPSEQGHYGAEAAAVSELIAEALEEAKLHPDEIDIIGLAANGVGELELLESEALTGVFGSKWYHIPRVPLRCFLGEFGSAGLASIATILLAIRNGVIPPHAVGPHLTGEPSSGSRFTAPRQAALHHGMIIGSTFSGGSSCAVVSRA